MLTLIAHTAVPPLAVDLWLGTLPGLAVGALLPSARAGIAVAAVVLVLQHLLLVALLLAGWRYGRALLQSSSPASSPGNSTSVKPNWLKSRTRIG